MKCSCCGKEISTSDRYCPNCGQNNDLFVETITKFDDEKKQVENPVINVQHKSIGQNSINSNNQVSSNSSNREKKWLEKLWHIYYLD